MTMYYVYLLKSRKDGKLYIGSTSRLNIRIKEHNEGLVFSTKGRRPLEVIYFECYKSEKDARKREKNLKLFSRAYYALKKRIVNSL
jgi:putative endonuclease